MTAAAGESSQAPIVLLHGATSSARAWDALIPPLGETYRVFAPTLAGHCDGPPLPAGDAGVVERIVDSTCRQLDEAAIDTAHIVGNSLGGWVALELARRGRAKSVLALSPAGAWRSPRDLRRLLVVFRAGAALAGANYMSQLVAHKRARRILLRLMAEHSDRLTLAQVAAMFEDMAACSALPDILDGARNNGPIEPFLDVKCPVRIAWGTHDRMLPFMRYGVPMLLAIPDAELRFLPGVGHVPMVDDPVLVANMILDYVESNESLPEAL